MQGAPHIRYRVSEAAQQQSLSTVSAASLQGKEQKQYHQYHGGIKHQGNAQMREISDYHQFMDQPMAGLRNGNSQ